MYIYQYPINKLNPGFSRSSGQEFLHVITVKMDMLGAVGFSINKTVWFTVLLNNLE